jgi:ABC-2 type transport system permease protein
VALVSLSLLSLGFVLASLVRTARFAQPLGSILLYALLAISGLFFPLEVLPDAWRVLAFASPLTHGVDLLRGLWTGAGWASQWTAVFALVANLGLCTALAGRIFRWE